MHATPVVIDGLWRCFCPSIEANTISRLIPPLRRSPIRPCLYATKRRTLLSRSVNSQTKFYCGGPASVQTLHRVDLRENGDTTTTVRDNTKQFTTSSAVPNRPPSYARLDEVPLTALLDTLRNIGTKDGAYKSIVDLVEYLVQSREEKPNLPLYDALIRANADASHGSADAVANLLREVKEENIVPDCSLYHNALQALAIHPDHLLRSEVLREMKDRWYTLTTDGWHSLVVGLLRDRQYEIALDKLEQMQREGTRVHPWLYDIFIYLFCEAEELDEAVKLLRYRVDHGDMDISANVWYYVLDACSTNYHHEGTQYVWRKRVETSYINPSDGMCTNVLNIAARYKDPNLATDVVRVLASRTSKLDIHHYEALISAYASSSNLKTVLQIFNIMKNARLEPTEATTRPIYDSLSKAERLPSQVFKVLQTFRRDGLVVPVAAVNVIIEACVAHGHLKEAIKQYKILHEICPSGPNTSTFNALLQGCSKNSGNKDLAMFLASEMAALGIRPDVLTYDRLILVCLTEEDYEDAFRYLEEMKAMFEGSELRTGTSNALIRRCAAAGDERTWTIMEEMRSRGHRVERIKRWLQNGWNSTATGAIPTGDGENIEKGRYRAQM